jgi:hypothetical protein
MMANRFGTDIVIQAPDPKRVALFYVQHLGFEITDNTPKMIGLPGEHINLFIEPGPKLGPVLEVAVDGLDKAKKCSCGQTVARSSKTSRTFRDAMLETRTG